MRTAPYVVAHGSVSFRRQACGEGSRPRRSRREPKQRWHYQQQAPHTGSMRPWFALRHSLRSWYSSPRRRITGVVAPRGYGAVAHWPSPTGASVVLHSNGPWLDPPCSSCLKSGAVVLSVLHAFDLLASDTGAARARRRYRRSFHDYVQ